VFLSDGALFSDRALGGVYVAATAPRDAIHASQREAMRLLLSDVHAAP
jgi:hypothetical protein